MHSLWGERHLSTDRSPARKSCSLSVGAGPMPGEVTAIAIVLGHRNCSRSIGAGAKRSHVRDARLIGGSSCSRWAVCVVQLRQWSIHAYTMPMLAKRKRAKKSTKRAKNTVVSSCQIRRVTLHILPPSRKLTFPSFGRLNEVFTGGIIRCLLRVKYTVNRYITHHQSLSYHHPHTRAFLFFNMYHNTST